MAELILVTLPLFLVYQPSTVAKGCQDYACKLRATADLLEEWEEIPNISRVITRAQGSLPLKFAEPMTDITDHWRGCRLGTINRYPK